MAKTFASSLPSIDTTPLSVAAILTAAGYTGSMIGKYLSITNPDLSPIFRGLDSGLTAADGIPIVSNETWEMEAESLSGLIDAANIWLVRAAAPVTFQLTWEAV